MGTLPPRTSARLGADADTEALRGTSRSPRLDKLKQRSPSLGLGAQPRSWEPPTRRKDLREHALVRTCETALLAARNQQAQQRSGQYHARWPQLRDLYAFMFEAMATIGSRWTLSPMSPPRMSAASTPPRSPAALGLRASTAPALWLRDVAWEFRRAFPVSDVTLAQLEIAVSKALHVDVFAAPAFAAAAARWRAAFLAFQRPETLKTDYRELLCALTVLDRSRAGERTLLGLWFEEFATVPLGAKVLATAKPELRRLLVTACEGVADEKLLEPFAADLVGACSGAYVSERAFAAYLDSTPELLEIVKAQRWRRLTDDMRLAFYRDLFTQANAQFQDERLRVRLEAALRLWRSREPRRRIARWKLFVADRRLVRRGDARFCAVGARKAVAALRRQRRRRQEMRTLVGVAHSQRCRSLALWAFQGWKLFVLSTRLIHASAWRRGLEHHKAVWTRKTWRALVKFFLVADAEVRERALHRDVAEQARMRSELALLAAEDAASRATELKARELLERERQRAFQDATNRVHARRKLQQQEDTRTRSKQAREAQVRAEMDATWQRLAASVRVEVRQAALAWFATPGGAKAVAAEATRIFEQDPSAVQRALLQNPQAFALPGCRWQLQLEDYGGRFAKPFYLNTETFEKLVCDELVLENCDAIAREVLVQRRIDAATAELARKATALARARLEHDAARRIQALFRCRHALLVARSLVRAVFVKRVDPSSGGPVYLNTRRGETRRRPPRIIGSDEPLIPVESVSWVRRCDELGTTYYARLDAREGDTEPALAWRPPSHYLLCTSCTLDFATRRWSDSGARVCVGCFASELKQRKREGDAGWSKLPVQPANCVVCRHALADRLCHDCRGDVTCERCFRSLHATSKLSNHSRHERLHYEAA
ncbi:hypothetical protein PybrP1_002544 [[Pythium] brassicae (nom. inval.)]|nr:hypothetical protein PybrP1_002544 [[Pythium] brassicae (nom. inval.)]